MNAIQQTNGPGQVALSPPPPDVVQDVRVEAVAAALESVWAIEPPPPDSVQDVRAEAVAAALESQWAIEPPPPDSVQDVRIEAIAAAASAPSLDAVVTWADDLVPLDTQTAYRIVRAVAARHSGEALYAAVSTADGPTLGLRFGLLLWPQLSRHFGSALRMMQLRDPGGFAEVFGPAAEELIAVTTSVDPAARLSPVGGELLTSPAWVERFRAAGAVEAFQAAQNEEAIEHQLRPLVNVAAALGQRSEAELEGAFGLVTAHGLGEGIRLLIAGTAAGAGKAA